jgi:hypothetical protein
MKAKITARDAKSRPISLLHVFFCRKCLCREAMMSESMALLSNMRKIKHNNSNKQ